ncbi:hypothetical protein FXO38_27834 [Capsicum annuum]|uniref:eEF1A lysine and N-terminal methyltransferase isoform X1 n=2 Tax=Capsicum annuum TaxID=4072 RepID=UPI001FB0503C|nr:eEF1A lysine and N-terminal methyltransferase isoform X1 [Capsicum annuum]KAF3629173.1 hypothetical protein FXO38_27834 [Capsicum annuum]
MGKKHQKNLQNQEELLKTLGDFTSKENWDSFFSIRGSDNAFEWYAEWPQLKEPLLSNLIGPSSNNDGNTDKEMFILVPGCGNSKLSEYLYDEGFCNITNVDFSKVVISDMLRRNIRKRPVMKWRVMDMTNMQFANESFGAILDKGGLDALMEPELGSKLGTQYLSEVKRLLKVGGRFFCLTLAESHVLGLLFPKFRYGWKMVIHPIAMKPSDKSSLQTFMVVAEKENSPTLCQIVSTVNQSSFGGPKSQVHGLCQALEEENKIRADYSSGSDITYALEDLKIGVEGNLAELCPNRRIQLSLGEPGISLFCYRAVLLDARKDFGPFTYHCAVFLVPKARAREWLFSSEEGQWVVVESSNAARLIMIFLDSSHLDASTEDIQKDLSPLIMQLAPGNFDDEAQIPFMEASDGIKQRKIIIEITSPLTGPIIVDDVIYEKVDDNISRLFASEDVIFRRLTFQRTENLVQSEAVLSREGPPNSVADITQKIGRSTSKSKKKGNQKKSGSNSSSSDGLSSDLKVDHSYLASSYHTGIISGFTLISSHLDDLASMGGMVRSVVIGLGAGLLPMFLHKHLNFAEIEVLELDPVVVDLARDYFDFRDDERLKVHVTDGLKYVKDSADAVTNDLSKSKVPSSNGNSIPSSAPLKSTEKIDILIVDVDSSDSSSGLSCPAADFVEESFLMAAKDSLSDQGLFVINLVSRSQAIKDSIYSKLKSVFPHLFHLQLDEDVNEVIFALKTETCTVEDKLHEASQRLARLSNLENSSWGQDITETTSKIKRLR